MRKIIYLGLLAVTLTLLSGHALAGNESDCDPLIDPNSNQYAPNLYGLCVAWHHADEDTKDKIAENFRRRSGGKAVPGSSDFSCSCWRNLSYGEVGMVLVDGSPTELSVSFCDVSEFNSNDRLFLRGSGYTQGFSAGFSNGAYGCAYLLADPEEITYSIMELTDGEARVCRQELQGIALLYEEDCVPTN